jgi:MscS family membrane protein
VRRLGILLALLIASGAPLASTSARAARLESPPPQTALAVPAEVVPFYDSPRACIENFYRAMGLFRGDARADKRWLLEAERSLDLPGGGQSSQFESYVGQSTANDLLYVLDHLLDPSTAADRDWLQQVPDAAGVAAAGSRWIWERRVPDSGAPPIAIEFTRKDDGRWLVSRETIARVRDLWDQVRPFPRLVARPLTLSERLRERIPARFQEVGFLLEHWQWIALGVLLVIGLLVDRVFRALSGRIVLRLAGRRRGLLDRETLSRFERPVGVFAGACSARALLPMLDLAPEQFRQCDYAISVFLVGATVWATYRLVDVFCGYLDERAALTESKFDDMLVPLLRRTLRLVVLVLGGIFLAVQAGGDLWSVIAGLSVGSLALGFAARDSIENLFGTFTVLLDKPFQLGDLIKMGEVEGTIEQVGLRSTRVRTPIDSLMTVPNRRFISDTVENLGARDMRRVRTALTLNCDTSVASVDAYCEGLRELLRRHPGTDKQRYWVSLAALSASSIDVDMICYVRAPDYTTEVRERHRLLSAARLLAAELRVDFAYPTQTLHVERAGAAARARRSDSADAVSQDSVTRGRAAADRIAVRALYTSNDPVLEPAVAADIDLRASAAPSARNAASAGTEPMRDRGDA